MASREASTPPRIWIARAVVVALVLLVVCLDDLPAPQEYSSDFLRRGLQAEDEPEGGSESASAQAALIALEHAIGVLDQIMDAHDPLKQQDAKEDTKEDAKEDTKEDAKEDAAVQEQAHAAQDEQQAAQQEPVQPDATREPLQETPEQPQQPPTPQDETPAENSSLQQQALDALGEDAHNRSNQPPPPPIQSREKYFGKVFPETNHVDMPFYLRNTFEPMPEKDDERDIIFFWHIPKTAGQLVKNVMGMCFGLKRAEKMKQPATLEFVHDVIVNVDTNSPEGISEAHELGLVDSNMVDFISSTFVLSASSLFTPQHRGRAFTIMRHPIDAAASNFHARKVKHPELRGKYTLAEYVGKNYFIDNWVTRQLTGTLPHEEVTQVHVDRAKNILAAKFFVGIYEHMDETMRQLKAFYSWKALEGQEYCVTDLIHGSNPKFQKTYRGKPARGSNDWAFVAHVEKWDMELYYFGLEVFSKQGRIWDADEYSLIETGRYN